MLPALPLTNTGLRFQVWLAVGRHCLLAPIELDLLLLFGLHLLHPLNKL
jgi:hypothetical protein